VTTPPQRRGRVIGLRQRRAQQPLPWGWLVFAACAVAVALAAGTTLLVAQPWPHAPRSVRLSLLANLRSTAPRYAEAAVVLRFTAPVSSTQRDRAEEAVVGAIGDTSPQGAVGVSGLEAVRHRIARAVSAAVPHLASVAVTRLLVLDRLPSSRAAGATGQSTQ
jgi:hypothetical protein